MLRRLSVENYVLIDKLEMELDPHLNIITGETGAGKSILLGALGLLLACIGESNVTGEGRFIFHEALTSGIAIVPALIGLFAVPQVVEMKTPMSSSKE